MTYPKTAADYTIVSGLKCHQTVFMQRYDADNSAVKQVTISTVADTDLSMSFLSQTIFCLMCGKSAKLVIIITLQ